MNFENKIKALSLCIQTRVPALLEGGVGEAKTAIVSALFKRWCDDHQLSIVALHEPTEYGGFPVKGDAVVADGAGQEACVNMVPLQWLRRLAKAKRPGLFLDEFSNGAPATR